MSTVNLYRVWCLTGTPRHEYVWATSEPTVSPKDGGAIDTSLTTIISNIPPNLVDTGASYDAFGRLRVSQLTTILDLKQTTGQLPMLIDQKQGGSGDSTFNSDESSTTLSTSASGDYAISQTFQRGQYQSGKSALIEMTFAGFQSETNIIKRVGYFNSSTSQPYSAGLDGIFMESNSSGIYFKVYRNGVEVDSIERANWIDPCDGSAACPNIDFSQAQILSFDFQWLGVGRVAFYFNIGNETFLAHILPHSNLTDKVYMQYSNHSLRWEIRQTGAGSGSFKYICAAFHTEGSTNVVGKQFSNGLGYRHLDANTPGVNYAIAGIRLANSDHGLRIDILRISLISLTSDAFLWEIRQNPTVADNFNYSALENSNVEIALGDTSNNSSRTRVTGGTVVDSGYVNRGNSNSFSSEFSNGIRLGAAIDGTRDTFVLCVSPVEGYSNMNITGSMTWLEST